MSAPEKFRPIPREVEAIRYDGTNEDAILAFMRGPEHARVEKTKLPGPGRGLRDGIRIDLFGGHLRVAVGQWIVRERHSGRETHQAVWNDVFVRTYEPVDKPALAGVVEVRDPCPHCPDGRLVPRSLMADHVSQEHPHKEG